jgi:hypothetical protein
MLLQSSSEKCGASGDRAIYVFIYLARCFGEAAGLLVVSAPPCVSAEWRVVSIVCASNWVVSDGPEVIA